MLEWLKCGHVDAQPQCVLLYRASRDGWSGEACRLHCVNNRTGGGILIVIRSLGGYVFGGTSAGFLFTLRCHAGLGPTRIGLQGNGTEYRKFTLVPKPWHGSTQMGPNFGGELTLGTTMVRRRSAITFRCA
jgi:hypothetical protein